MKTSRTYQPERRLPARMRLTIVSLVVGASSVVAPVADAASKSNSKAGVRTIDVEMLANAYKPTLIKVGVGETVNFRFVNTTVAPHEALIGDMNAQIKHAKEMKAMAKEGGTRSEHMDHAPSKGYVLVKAKSTKTMSYKFTKAGRLLIGCHQPGHWEGGMKLTLVIAPKSAI